MRNDLTLNLGLTWEYTSPWVEKDDRQSNIDLATGQLLLAGQNGNSRALYDAYYGAFEPRVGVAWTPDRRLGRARRVRHRAVHGRAPARTCASRRIRRSTSRASACSILTTGAGSAAVGFADVVPNVNGGPGTLYPDLRAGSAAAAHEAVERVRRAQAHRHSCRRSLATSGSRSDHMVVPFDFNQPEPDPGPVSTWRPLDQRRPLYPLNPNIGTTSGTNSIGVGAYDALQASVRQRPADGLEFMASYTYSKSLSDNVGYYGVGWGQTAGQGYYYLDSTDPLRDYGPSPYDMRHIFSFAAIYELPFGKERKYGNRLRRARRMRCSAAGCSTASSRRTRGLAFTVKTAPASRCRRRARSSGRIVCATAQIDGAGVDDVWIDISCFQQRAGGPVRRFRRPASCTARATGTGTSAWQELLFQRQALRDVPDRGVQRAQSSELRAADRARRTSRIRRRSGESRTRSRRHASWSWC